MQTDMMALALPIALYLITSLIGYKIIMKEKRAILAAIDVKIQGAIDDVAGALGQIFEKPIVKASMTNLGKMGGEAMQQKSIMNNMALDVLAGPKFEALKLVAKQALNLDVDQYIEENGAVATLQAAQGLGDLVGVDITQALAGGLNGANLAVGHESSSNYYLTK